MDREKIKRSNYVSFVWQQCQPLWEYGGGGVKDDHWFLITRQPDPSPRWILWFVNPAVPTNQKTISLPLSPSPSSGLFWFIFRQFCLCDKHFLSLYLSPESIEWYIEDQAFLQLYGAAPRIPIYPLLSRQQLVSLSESSCVSWRRGGREGEFEEPNHTAVESRALYDSFNTLCLFRSRNPSALLRQSSLWSTPLSIASFPSAFCLVCSYA